jgi:hypothetical protein
MAESLELVSGFLEENGIEYEVVEHDERFTAAAEARASGVEPIDAAKDVLLRIDDAYVLAEIPASKVDPSELVTLTKAGVADLCQD